MGNGLWKRDGNEYLFVRDGKCARRVPQGPVDLGTGTTEESFSSPRNRTLVAKQLGIEKRETGATRSGGPWLWHDRGEL